MAGLSVVLVLAGCATAGTRARPAGPSPTVDPAPDRLGEIRRRVGELVDDARIPSIAVSVVEDGEIVWEEGFGWADVAGGVPATADTPYSLASVSKPVTATGLMVLVERGLVDLDAPVDDYLGGARLDARTGDAADATVRRVADHTAGLPLHHRFFWSDGDDERPPMPVTIRRWGNLVTAPGERYRYSNLGYGILGYVIERVSGSRYPRFLRQEVFRPLGMTASSVPLPPGPEGPHARRYRRDGSPLPFYDFDHRGASAVYASAHDLALFALFHLGRSRPDQERILSRRALDEMQSVSAETGDGAGYGIGWTIRRRPDGRRVVGHGGGMAGVTAKLALVPAEDLAVAVLANTRGPWPYRVSEAILDALLARRSSSTGEDPVVTGTGGDPGLDEIADDRHRSRGGPVRPSDPAAGIPGRLVGTWTGSVDDPRGRIEASLRVGPEGEVGIRVGRGSWRRLLVPRFRDGFLTGRLPLGAGSKEHGDAPRFLLLEVKLRGDRLNGSLTTITSPPDRVGNALTAWIELRRDG